jgi:putative restriction endonuclease
MSAHSWQGLWGYQSFHAISKGVVTPSNTNSIIFFVTKDKQEALTQYNDYIDGDMLFLGRGRKTQFG